MGIAVASIGPYFQKGRVRLLTDLGIAHTVSGRLLRTKPDPNFQTDGEGSFGYLRSAPRPKVR